jgi:alpha-aminoadipic semialdehyde synthase
VERLVRDEGVRVIVQPSDIRVFDAASYEAAGATISEDLSPCHFVFAVKEVPPDLILPDTVYMYFAHVVKGQTANMPMLRRLVETGCSLIDYERIVDEAGRRLVFFGRFAGLAGMIDSLWALGKRLAHEGRPNPFADLKAAWQYGSLDAARQAMAEVGEKIGRHGLGADLAPFIIGIAGYGNVSLGAQEILDLFPVKEIGPDEVAWVAGRPDPSDKTVYKVVFKERDMVTPRAEGAAFDLKDYYDFPAKYAPVLSGYLPHLTVLVNCIYWDDRYPHFVSRADLADLYSGPESPWLRVIGDISCDVGGGVEATVKATTPEAPVYVYDVGRGRAIDGVAGKGPVILAVYNLPAELPYDSSVYFGSKLEPYAAPIAYARWDANFGEAGLPAAVRAATILYRGEFTPPYQYLERYIG